MGFAGGPNAGNERERVLALSDGQDRGLRDGAAGGWKDGELVSRCGGVGCMSLESRVEARSEDDILGNVRA